MGFECLEWQRPCGLISGWFIYVPQGHFIYSCGHNEMGQLGYGHKKNDNLGTPMRVYFQRMDDDDRPMLKFVKLSWAFIIPSDWMVNHVYGAGDTVRMGNVEQGQQTRFYLQIKWSFH